MDFSQYKQETESYLDNILPNSNAPDDLAAAMRYSVLNNGKRLRPCLVFATGELLNVSMHKLHAPAAAVELIHCYSLIHDDLPAMDNDDLRRGKPTCHKAFSESTAILAGDALQAMAFEILSDPDLNPIPAAQQVAQVNILAGAAGAQGMVLGQSADIASEQKTLGLKSLTEIHHLKTGALFKSCVALALQASNYNKDQDVADKLDAYAENLGLLFQIQDDILDVTGDVQTIGKPVGSDQQLAKATYPSLLGLEAAKQHAQNTLQRAIDALNDFGASAGFLRNVAQFALNRSR